MIPLGYAATVAMVRRGFDLSGDQGIDPHPAPGSNMVDAPTGSVFNFCYLLMFSALAVAAICYRRRPEVHKRLMVFANIALIAAPIAHLSGHFPQLEPPEWTNTIPYTLFLISVVARDYLVTRRIRPLSAGVATGMFAALPLQAFVIGPSETWHRLVIWISQ